jgi:hypothetical protein
MEGLLLMRDHSTRQLFIMSCDGGKGDMQPYYDCVVPPETNGRVGA